jgi:hypothetical protein
MIDTADPFAQLTPKTVVRFPNLSGALVEVRTLREEWRIGEARLVFGAGCAGCLEAYDNGRYLPGIDHPRTWAAKHSATCRALPQPEPNQQ